jgi:hypothetical protein
MPAPKRPRSHSTPAHRAISEAGPDPWLMLQPLGDKTNRTATALAELAVATRHQPELWDAQEAITDAILHDVLYSTDRSWRAGCEHGAWMRLKSHEDSEADLRHRLYDMEQRFVELERQHEEAKAYILAHTLRDITNFAH